ncbi:hypothetical protein J2755_000010 [Methanohalophilus levihalophilus]|uniref:helix-turn-helix transcriptional regulator n=1 Tax=Methanohalophilus levihalophilus TaxID=1431282 RepID=UPI001AEAAF74|nr:hypothetical protein [Methanohalophilus levihalophilus]MBP2029090.1 hypothetical protein [Methanohalophilus levihalophilus]
MEKKDTIYVILLAFSLFSLSLMLFSQGITSLSVSLRDGNNVAVEVPNLFPLTHVVGMLFMTMIATFCLTMLIQDILVSKSVIPSSNRQIAASLPYIEDPRIVSGQVQDCKTVDEATSSNPYVPTKTSHLRTDPEQKTMIASKILEGDVRKVYKIIAENGEILQSDLVLESGFSKVKVSRTLKKLEDKSLIERKPYGNTNKIILSK